MTKIYFKFLNRSMYIFEKIFFNITVFKLLPSTSTLGENCTRSQFTPSLRVNLNLNNTVYFCIPLMLIREESILNPAHFNCKNVVKTVIQDLFPNINFIFPPILYPLCPIKTSLLLLSMEEVSVSYAFLKNTICPGRVC